jgi:hypothetical protein
VLASGTQVRGFKPGRSLRIFKSGKILSTPSFGREFKPWAPCLRFSACKRNLNVQWKSAFRQNYRYLFSAHKFQLPQLECGTGASSGQSWNVQSGRYIKPAGCSTSVACRGRPWKQTNKPKRLVSWDSQYDEFSGLRQTAFTLSLYFQSVTPPPKKQQQ